MVTTLNDGSTGSLRWAVANAPSGSTITFDKNLHGTINLTSGDISIRGKLTIDGPGESTLAISSGSSGSAILISQGATGLIKDLGFQNSQFDRFTTQDFITNEGTLSLEHGLVSNNKQLGAQGGIIQNSGVLSISSGTIINNTSLTQFYGGTSDSFGGHGGAIHNDTGGILTVINSTVSGNLANEGGAIFNDGTLSVINCTIAGNSAN